MSRMSWCSSLAHWCCVCETPEEPFIEYVLAAPIEARAEAPDGPNPNAAPGGGSDTLDARFNLDALELACDVTDESETRLYTLDRSELENSLLRRGDGGVDNDVVDLDRVPVPRELLVVGTSSGSTSAAQIIEAAYVATVDED